MTEAATQAKLAVFNDAMDLADKTAISSFGSDSPTGAKASRRFLRASAWVLGLYPWTFAKTFKPLARLSDPPASQYDHVFDIPGSSPGGDRILAIYDREDCLTPFTAYRKIGAHVHSDAEALWAELQSTIADDSIERWPPSFREAVVRALAADRVDSRTKRADLIAEGFGTPGEYPRGGLLAEAAATDGHIEPGGILRMGNDPLTAARFS